MRDDILTEAQRLRAEGRPFALATVVAVRQPSSGVPGSRAIILPDGQLVGWVGGHCAQPAVTRQGLESLVDGSARLLRLSPEPQATDRSSGSGAVRDGIVEVPMLCGSQGEMQVFVEPFLPQPALVVIGASAVARTLVRLAAALDFEAWACDPHADMTMFPDAERLAPSLDALTPQLTARNYVVIATIGEYDEDAAYAALTSPASYVGLVASHKRLAAVQAYLREQGMAEERVSLLTRPAGIQRFVVTPEEIAFSVMAELLEVRRKRVGLRDAAAEQMGSEAAPVRAEATDPICGMTVDIATARYTTEWGGETYYFCCAGCKRTFEKEHAVTSVPSVKG